MLKFSNIHEKYHYCISYIFLSYIKKLISALYIIIGLHYMPLLIKQSSFIARKLSELSEILVNLLGLNLWQCKTVIFHTFGGTAKLEHDIASHCYFTSADTQNALSHFDRHTCSLLFLKIKMRPRPMGKVIVTDTRAMIRSSHPKTCQEKGKAASF